MFEQLKKFIQIKRYTTQLQSKLLQNLQTKFIIEQLSKKYPNLSTREIILFSINDLTPSTCHQCGNYLNFEQTKSNHKFCSRKCSDNSPERFINSGIGTRKSRKEHGKEISEKIKNTCLKKYGVTTNLAFSNCHSKEKVRKTKENNLKKYGTESNFNIPEVREKTNQGKFTQGWNTILSWKDYITPMFSREEYHGKKRGQIYKWKCSKCGLIFDTDIKSTKFVETGKAMPICPRCYPCINRGVSQGESQLALFCKEYFNEVKTSSKSFISPFELDIVIPQINIAIEYNGNWYHSIEAGTPLNYHLNKTLACEKIGIRLIHIFENEWLFNKEEIKQKLINIFENKEVVDYSQLLDRCWYRAKEIEGYKLEILPPSVFEYDNLHIENCGYLKYTKI